MHWHWSEFMVESMTRLDRRSRYFAAIDRLQSLFDMALSPGGLRALATQRPLSLSAFALTSRLARLGFAPRSLIDVGANTGQFTAAALYQWPDLEVHAFEPLPREGTQLRDNFAGQSNVHVENLAIGDEEGVAVLHRHAHSLSSSLLPTTLAARNRFPWAVERDDIEVPVRRLDSLFSSVLLPRPVLLKIDVQGFESQVLSGAKAMLTMISAIVVEQAFEPFYEGQHSFSHTHGDLFDACWELSRVLSIRCEDGLPVEADCLYVPTDSPPLTMVPRSR
jgi:FkbM family methyltransferase